jgi:hypothetical protein
MRTVLLFFLLMGTFTISAQNVLDSIQVYDYPVRHGTIYKYEYDCNSTTICAPSLSIVSVVTPNDSVFHFEEGSVVGIFTLDDFHTITVRNTKDEFITYSNLQYVTVKKGDHVTRGMFLGTAAKSDEGYAAELNQVDILILRKVKQLSYRKAIEYIRFNMSSPGKPSRFTSFVGSR